MLLYRVFDGDTIIGDFEGMVKPVKLLSKKKGNKKADSVEWSSISIEFFRKKKPIKSYKVDTICSNCGCNAFANSQKFDGNECWECKTPE